MANRPRLPDVDPQDLATLAKRYPGSADAKPEDNRPDEGKTDEGKTGKRETGEGKAAAAEPDGAKAAKTGKPEASGADGSGSSGSDGKAKEAPVRSAATSNEASGVSMATGNDKAKDGPATASSGEAAASSGSAATPPPLSAGGRNTPPPASRPEAPAERRGSWSATFMTFLFALIALAAAAIAVGAPSYRAEVRDLLRTHASEYLAPETIDLVTGYDPDRLEVTYDGLDQRIDELTQSLERVASARNVSPEAARELLLGDELRQQVAGLGERVDALDSEADTAGAQAEARGAQLDSLSGQVEQGLAEITERVGTLEQTAATQSSLEETAGALQSSLNETTSALQSSLEETTGELRTSIDTIQAGVEQTKADLEALTSRADETGSTLSALATRDGEIADQVTAVSDRLSQLTTDFNALLDVNERVAAVVSRFETESLPILALAQLRPAAASSAPFARQLAFVQGALSGSPAAAEPLAILEPFAQRGTDSVDDLRQDLDLIAAEMGVPTGQQPPSWTSQVGTWFAALVGSFAEPVAPARSNGLEAAVRTIDHALSRGSLDLALREASLIAGAGSGAMRDWIVGLQDRAKVDAAVGRLETIVYGQGTTGAGAPADAAPSKAEQ